MSNTITITDPGWPWDLTSFFLILTGGLLVLGLIALSITSTRKTKAAQNRWAGVHTALLIAFVFSSVVSVLSIPLLGSDLYTARVDAEKVAELSDLGYASVDLKWGGKFTADLDGDYFSGALISVGANTWQIVELGASK